ncbi:MAG: hypothetical protein Edafosvirus1_24 [Edafosvirus sp.]|uniref:Uncharacterized protein n=1 Tax=Edafosvirus sp. TaxID=2487765 RepID=A0A3G4ZVP6_9VIRU|nr:MAG: hypothetical protein Edafosvirus1_24 [Edafosvirus sp.]
MSRFDIQRSFYLNFGMDVTLRNHLLLLIRDVKKLHTLREVITIIGSYFMKDVTTEYQLHDSITTKNPFGNCNGCTDLGHPRIKRKIIVHDAIKCESCSSRNTYFFVVQKPDEKSETGWLPGVSLCIKCLNLNGMFYHNQNECKNPFVPFTKCVNGIIIPATPLKWENGCPVPIGDSCSICFNIFYKQMIDVTKLEVTVYIPEEIKTKFCRGRLTAEQKRNDFIVKIFDDRVCANITYKYDKRKFAIAHYGQRKNCEHCNKCISICSACNYPCRYAYYYDSWIVLCHRTRCSSRYGYQKIPERCLRKAHNGGCMCYL